MGWGLEEKKRKRGNQYIEEPRNDKWYTANEVIDIASCHKTINAIPQTR